MSAESLWTIEKMREAMQAVPVGALPPFVTGISIDSRTIAPGEAYFAIKGDVHDGHAFVANAIRTGGSVAIIDDAHRAMFEGGLPLLVVPDVLEALRRLGIAARARTSAKVIAVTGSVGKTSTKEALRLVLGAEGKTHASAASFNNHWGVPLTLARCPQDARFAVFEIGMNHAGEITPLVKMVRPHVAIITTVEPVHLEFFKSVEAIADAKAEIFNGLVEGGVAVLNHDNDQFQRLVNHAKAKGVARIVSFGEHKSCDARLIDAALQPDCSAVRARIFGEDVAYKVGMPGRHMVMNSLAVLAAATLAGADLAVSMMALGLMTPPPGRGARKQLTIGAGKALLINESYNANPASMRAALAVLGHAEIHHRGRRIAILGDMLELGPEGPALHAALAGAIAESRIDLVYCCGPLMHHLWEALPANRRGGYAQNSDELQKDVAAVIQVGDALMIKGSLGSKMKTIVTRLEQQFPEWNSAAAAM